MSDEINSNVRESKIDKAHVGESFKQNDQTNKFLEEICKHATGDQLNQAHVSDSKEQKELPKIGIWNTFEKNENKDQGSTDQNKIDIKGGRRTGIRRDPLEFEKTKDKDQSDKPFVLPKHDHSWKNLKDFGIKRTSAPKVG